MRDADKSLPDSNKIAPRERLARLRLIRSENVGPINYRRLLAHFGSAVQALSALPDLARRGGRKRPIKPCALEVAEAELSALKDLGAVLVTLGEPAYPAALAAIEDAPPAIALLGRLDLLERQAVAVVGARNASANGRRLAKQLASGLGESGLLVVSGMARGIDTAAHQGALAAGTCAVVAGGIDVVYPPENRELYDSIREAGLLMTEVPPGVEPQARHFPRRNRLISGLSLGVVVVEAAPRSGSLITARLAAEQGREVFAVPGSPLDPRARGCNGLLRQGATLTESAADVLEGLADMAGSLRPAPKPAEFREFSADRPAEAEVESALPQIESLLGMAPVTVDELIRQCQLSPAVVHMALLELELAGRAERHPGNRVALSA